MADLVVVGGSIQFTPNPPAIWAGAPGIVQFNAGVSCAHAGSAPIISEPELLQVGQLLIGTPYMVPGAFDVPGAVTQVQLTVNQGTLARQTKLAGAAAVLVTTTGTFTAVCVPAVNAVTGVPDPTAAALTGTFAITDAGQLAARSV